MESKPKLPYPKAVFFIVSNEFCERFAFYGMRTILTLYLSYQLSYSNDMSTIIYHVFVSLCYFTPILGAIIADSWLGKFNTILYLSIIYALGSAVMAVSAVNDDGIPRKELAFLGLVLIAIGTGGIKPCVSSFGGDQFVVPDQDSQLQTFFSVFYASINAGSLISTFITPILREDVKCLGQDSCYPLAFGVPAIIMVVSVVVFMIGSRWYKVNKPQGNVVVKTAQLVWYASRKSNKTVKRDHWLDKGDDKYDPQFISDVKAALRVLVLYIPLPIFWALFDQQGSRWTFQAARMDGDFGSFNLKPDQMQVANPLLILLFIPMFEAGVYPLFARCNFLKRPLQRLVLGGLLAAVAFVVSAILELQLRGTYPVLPIEGEGQLRLYNNMGCDMNFDGINTNPISLQNFENWESLNITTDGSTKEFNVTWNDCENTMSYTQTITVDDDQATSYTFVGGKAYESKNENLDKSDEGGPTVMFMYGNQSEKWSANITVGVPDDDVELTVLLNETSPVSKFEAVVSGNDYELRVNGEVVTKLDPLKQGGGYVILIQENKASEMSAKQIEVTEPNSVNILWLLPQYIIMTAGEVMFSITGIEFSFTQAPTSMKSLLTSFWLLTVAVGNLIVVIVAEAKIFENQAYEFFLFAGLMLVDMGIFTLMAMRYTYVEDMPKPEDPNSNDIPLKEKE